MTVERHLGGVMEISLKVADFRNGSQRKWRSLNGMSVLPSRADIVN